MIKDIKYDELPYFIKIEVCESDFLTAYQCQNESNPSIVIWTIDRAINKQTEIEFDLTTKQKLCIEERKIRAPKPSTMKPEDPRFELRTSYYFEEETNTLHRQHTLFDLQEMQGTGSVSEPLYPTFESDPKETANSLLKKHNFPIQYTQWNNEQRVNYWTERLYRMRRQAGESGAHEDCAFDKTLAQEMESIDLDIKNILPDCIMKLSKLEQIDHADLLAAFRSRTGLMI